MMMMTRKRKNRPDATESVGCNAQTATAVDNLVSALTEESWKLALQPIFRTQRFQALATFVQKERQSCYPIFPKSAATWAALNVCPIDQVRVVIVGQDPYHQPDTASGLAFSVQTRPLAQQDDGTAAALPATLKNIFTELEEDPEIPDFLRPDHGCLDAWAAQGVLLLNTVLTVRANTPNSHRKQGWEMVTDAILEAVRQKPCVLLLWGKPAAEKVRHLTSNQHVIITCSHPSPLAARRTSEPFIGSRCFSRCNEALKQQGTEPIDWRLT